MLSRKKIVVVEDEVDLLDIFVEELRAQGADVFPAVSAEEAYRVLCTNPVDLVISDVRMPGICGLELLKTIRICISSELPVVFVSGFADVTEEKASDFGVSAVLRKPFPTGQLLEAATTALERARFSWGDRRFPRLANAREIHVDFPNYLKAKRLRLINIGRGGAYLRLGEELPKVNDVVDFRIDLRDLKETPICGTAVVRWIVEGNGVGVEFLRLDDENTRRLEELLIRFPSLSYIPAP